MDKSIVLRSCVYNSLVLHCCKCGARTYSPDIDRRYGVQSKYQCRNCESIFSKEELECISTDCFFHQPIGAKVWDNGDKVSITMAFNTIAHSGRLKERKETFRGMNHPGGIDIADLTKLKNKCLAAEDGLVFQKIRLRYTWNMKTGMSYMMYPKIFSGRTERVLGDFFEGPITNITFGCKKERYFLCLMFQKELAQVEAIIRSYHEKGFGCPLPEASPYNDNSFRNSVIERLSLLNRFPLTHPDVTKYFITRSRDIFPNPIYKKAMKKRDVDLASEMWKYVSVPPSIKKLVIQSIIRRDHRDVLENYLEMKDNFSSFDNLYKILLSGKDVIYPSLYNRRTTYHQKEVETFWSFLCNRVGESEATKKIVVQSYLLFDVSRMFLNIREAIPEFEFITKGNINRIHDRFSYTHKRIGRTNIDIGYKKGFERMNEEIEGYSFELAPDTFSLIDCANDLNLCVDSYDEACLKGSSIIVFVKKDGEFKVCLELNGSSLVQAKIFNNQYPEHDLAQIIASWCNNHHILIQTEDMHFLYKKEEVMECVN